MTQTLQTTPAKSSNLNRAKWDISPHRMTDTWWCPKLVEAVLPHRRAPWQRRTHQLKARH
jgi:hypothetical protein